MMTLTGSSAIESHLHDHVPDTASELLVAELVLNDIAAVQATRKGKAREDAPRGDEEIAFDHQAASLRGSINVLRDHRFALSIDRAIESDARPLARLALVEQAERDDHRAAVALGEGHDLPQQTLSQRRLERALALPDREPPSVHRTYAGDTAEADTETINVDMENVHITPVTSESVHRRFPRDLETGLECVICGDTVVKARSFKAPCAHRYCRSCIINLVETSLRDEGLHPLRCCHRRLPLESVFRFITIALQVQFLRKRREYSVPAASRVYCANPRCSAFLGEARDSKRNFTCHQCDTISCSQCKNNAHPGEDCSEYQSILELRETAAANKWQTCPGCHAIIELSQGCYHITCRCSTQFCYMCSARWKTCDCPQWDEDHLLDDAERRVRNEFGIQAAVQPAVHATRVHHQMEALRENHECQAHYWRYRGGCGQCEECGDFLRIYLMRCIHCQTLVCRRCSVNRL